MGVLYWLSQLSELYRMLYPWITLSKITWQMEVDCFAYLALVSGKLHIYFTICLQISLVNVNVYVNG